MEGDRKKENKGKMGDNVCGQDERMGHHTNKIEEARSMEEIIRYIQAADTEEMGKEIRQRHWKSTKTEEGKRKGNE